MKKNQAESIVKLEAQPEKQGSSGGAETGKSELDNNNRQVNYFGQSAAARTWQLQFRSNILYIYAAVRTSS